MEKSQEKPVDKSQKNRQAEANGKSYNLRARPKVRLRQADKDLEYDVKNLTLKKNAPTAKENTASQII